MLVTLRSRYKIEKADCHWDNQISFMFYLNTKNRNNIADDCERNSKFRISMITLF